MGEERVGDGPAVERRGGVVEERKLIGELAAPSTQSNVMQNGLNGLLVAVLEAVDIYIQSPRIAPRMVDNTSHPHRLEVLQSSLK